MNNIKTFLYWVIIISYDQFDLRVSSFDSKEVFVSLFVQHEKSGKLLESAFPTIKRGKSLFTDGTYVENCHESFATTDNGCIFVFGNTLFAKNYDESELDNRKYFVKKIKVTNCGLNCIRSING